MESSGRTVQQEGYQWAVLLGLIALLASVATNARAARSVIVALALIPFGLPPVAGAQTVPAAQNASALATDEAPVDEAVSEGLEELELPDDPREAYNRGLDALESGRMEDSERLLEAARSGAGVDGEARFRATYNLGWASVEKADQQMEADPSAALRALERAADWFREAVALREGSEQARRNLEIVLQRALVLADSLADRDERDLAARLDELIERQRAALVEIRKVVDAVAGNDDPDAVSGLRRVFRAAAVEERQLLSDAATFARFAGDELARLEAIPQEELSPEDGMRVAQLSALLHYVHRARERIGQARSQLRQRQAEHGFRRAAAGLGSLKRARDQLRDPVRVLDSILADAAQLTLETRALAASRQGLSLAATAEDESPVAPDWLTANYLADSQEDLAGRAGELQSRLHAGLASVEDAPPADPGQAMLVAAVRAAEPLVAAGHDKLLEADGLLKAEQISEAVGPQAQAVMHLAEARERFLDLKGLIELAYTDERRIAAVLDPEAGVPAERLGEYMAALTTLQESNLARLERLGPLLDAEQAKLAAELESEGGDPEAAAQQREQQQSLFESARGIVGFTSDRMQRAQAGLAALGQGGVLTPETQESVRQAIGGLTQLRRLFFSIVEFLRETAERQVELNDDTDEAVALAEAEPEETARRVGPLVPRQKQLAEITDQIAMGLHEQALAAPDSAAAAQMDEQQALEASERMTQAAELVIAGHGAMEAAREALEAETPEYATARERQGLAVEQLAQALALLSPPPEEQQPNQEEQPQQQGEQEQQGEGKGEGESEPQPEERADAADPSQLLQSVRDKEAQRHREHSEGKSQGYEPVEKDW